MIKVVILTILEALEEELTHDLIDWYQHLMREPLLNSTKQHGLDIIDQALVCSSGQLL